MLEAQRVGTVSATVFGLFLTAQKNCPLDLDLCLGNALLGFSMS